MQLTLRQHCHLQCSRNVQWSYKKKKRQKNLTMLSINLWFYIKMYLSLSWGARGMQGCSLDMPRNAFRDWCCPKCRDLNFSKCRNKSQDPSDGIRSSLLLFLTWKGLKKLSRLEGHMCSISSRSHTVSPPTQLPKFSMGTWHLPLRSTSLSCLAAVAQTVTNLVLSGQTQDSAPVGGLETNTRNEAIIRCPEIEWEVGGLHLRCSLETRFGPVSTYDDPLRWGMKRLWHVLQPGAVPRVWHQKYQWG